MPFFASRAAALHAIRRGGIALLLLATLFAQSPGLRTAMAESASAIEPYPSPAIAPKLQATPCLYARDEIPDSMRDMDITCGYVTVPQDHNDPNDKETIDLYVVQIPATGKHPSDTPLFVLGGGPGQGITGFLWSFDEDYGHGNIANLSTILEDHNVVLFDQRGTGKTLPEVTCPIDRVPEGTEPDIDDDEAAADDPYLACASQLADEGIDLNTYNNRQSAADIDAVRQALGASRIDLLGTSYGSMLALETMRYYPQIVRSSILNSPDIPEKQFFDSLMIGHQNALDAVFEACEADRDCDRAYPNLADTYTEVVAALNKKPMLLTFENPLTEKTEKAYADGSTFTNLVYQLVFFNVTIAYIPPLITSVAQGESEIFSALVPELISSSEGMSIPLHYAVLCQDEIPYVNSDEVMQKVEDAGVSQEVIDAEAGSMDMYFEICDAWDLTPSGEISNEPVVSDIPTLIITGKFDPITPTFDGQLLLDNLSNGVLVEIPTASHDPLDTSGTCGVGMAVAFLDHPRKELDTSCVADLTLDMSPDDESDASGR